MASPRGAPLPRIGWPLWPIVGLGRCGLRVVSRVTVDDPVVVCSGRDRLVSLGVVWQTSVDFARNVVLQLSVEKRVVRWTTQARDRAAMRAAPGPPVQAHKHN